MSISKFAFGLVAAAAFAVPAEAQIWSKATGRTTSSGDQVLRRAEQVYDGARCELLEVVRNGRREVERVCDYDGDRVYGDRDDRRIEADRRNRGMGVYGNKGGATRGQARAAEVHARNDARKREKQQDKREREMLKERQKREQELLKERQKRERERQKARNKRDG